MEVAHKKVLRALTLEVRHLLEGEWKDGLWVAGDLEQRLRSLGVRQDGTVVPVDELAHLPGHDIAARTMVDAWLTLRLEAGASGQEAVAELVRETAWSWATRLLALRCMEARGLMDDEVVVTKAVYAGRSMLHNRLVRKQPELERDEDGGLFTALGVAFAGLQEHLPRAFDPAAPGIALRPSVAALTSCIALLSGTQRPYGQEAATDEVFQAPDALGWAYQYWNTEEKQRVFDAAAGKGSDRKRHKIEGADIVPATQLYTEPYMVQFLVQNGLGGLWLSMHPDTALVADWVYFVRAAERPEVPARPVREITFLDPACGSGHFLLEAFDLFFAMYREEDPRLDATAIVGDILTRNLHGLDIDERAVHIAEVALWMKGAEVVAREGRGFPQGAAANLVATNVRLPKGGGHLDRFLERHPEDKPLRQALQVVFEGLEHADELGALLLLDEPVEAALRAIQAQEEHQRIEARRDSQVGMFGAGDRSRLPTSARSWEEWRVDVLTRLRDHFAAEARSADPVQAYFGRSVERALDLFDLLAQRYDVVAANPPYMGSKNMGPVLRKHVEKHFTAGKRDLYAAFILRCSDLLSEGGRTAIVAPQAWLFMRSYVGMRAMPGALPGTFSGLLADARMETLAQLGRHAFSEADPPSNVAMFVQHADTPDADHQPVCFRLALPRPAEEQARLLALGVAGNLEGLTWRPAQRAFLDIPQAPFCYWLRPRFLRLFAGKTLSDVGEVRQGMATADDGRFLRFTWETPLNGRRWVPFYKGGGYRKWDGLVNIVVDWELEGTRLRAFPRAVIRNPDAYFQSRWTYSLMARGRMGVRRQHPRSTFGHMGPAISLLRDQDVASLSSRVFSYLLRAISPALKFEVDSVKRGPVPPAPPNVDIETLVAAKANLTATDPTERAFTAVVDLPTLLTWCADLHTLEGDSERAVLAAYELDEDDIAAVVADTGTPAGWLSDDRSQAARERIRALFEAGPGGTVEADTDDAEDDEDDDAPDLGTGRPIHPETFLEELCEKAGVSPRAAWAVIQDGIASGWRCPPEERRLAADRVSVLALRILGHQWPLEVESGEPAPSWADADGIVPLTSIPHESPLIERLRARCTAEGLVEAELSTALEMPVDEWLHTRFAAHHTSQFKKRPVAWQVQSSTFTARNPPAFAALLYCQKVSAAMLASVRSQYVGPLLERRRQEVRTLEGAVQRSPAQQQQLKDVGLAVSELDRFADAIVAIEREGFATPGLRAIAVQDAVQSLLQPVLARWRGELLEGPLRGWAADGRAVDESLATALHEAVEALPCGCGRWAALIEAPAWEEETPAAADVRRAVLAASSVLIGEVSAALQLAVQVAFKAWMKAEREQAKAMKRKAPKFTQEKALVEALERRIGKWSPDVVGLPRFVDALPLLDAWCGEPGRLAPATLDDFVRQESAWRPDVNDGVRVNIAPLQRAGLLAADPLAAKDIEPAIADRATWRADERRWVREGKLPRPGWWPEEDACR